MHPLLILVLVFDLLIAVSSVLNLVNMMRVNLMVEERRAEALTVQRVRVQKAAAGKGGILASWYGVYACPAKDGTGEFTSSNPYGSEAAVPASTTVVPLKASGVLEQCDIAAHLRRRLVPLWITAAAFSASEQALPPSRLFGTRLFPCGPLTHRLPGRGTMPGKYKYKGRQLWNY